jgi:hypothetical protein
MFWNYVHFGIITMRVCSIKKKIAATLTEEWIQPFNFLKVGGCHQKLLSNYKILAETLLKVG